MHFHDVLVQPLSALEQHPPSLFICASRSFWKGFEEETWLHSIIRDMGHVTWLLLLCPGYTFSGSRGSVPQMPVVYSLKLQVKALALIDISFLLTKKGIIISNLLKILRINFFFFFSTVIIRRKWAQISKSCRMTNEWNPISWYPGLTYGCFLPIGTFLLPGWLVPERDGSIGYGAFRDWRGKKSRIKDNISNMIRYLPVALFHLLLFWYFLMQGFVTLPQSC